MKKVLIAAPVHKVLLDGLAKVGYNTVISENILQEEAFEQVAEYAGIITSTRLHIDKTMIDAAKRLEWIGRMGSGMEIIDVNYAQTKGIKCYSSPEGNANAVAEHAIGLLLSLSKRITSSAAEVKQGKWLRDANRGFELEGKTIAIIGLGNTGRAFAKKLSSFSMNILAYDKYVTDIVPSYVQCVDSFERIFSEAEIISFHVPLQDDTYYYFNEDFLSKFLKPIIVLNTSRGLIVNTEVLYKGLMAGKVKAAGLDVLEQEPLNEVGVRLRETLDKMLVLPQVLITPHIAGYSYEAVYKMSEVLLSKIVISS